MSAAVAVRLCPRCDKPGKRNHDEWVCFDHGTFHTPPRAGDPSGFDGADGEAYRERVGRIRARGNRPQYSAPWTEEEREEWDSWQEGDPLPGWAADEETDDRKREKDMTTPVPPTGRDEISAGEMVRLMKNRTETLAKSARYAIDALAKVQDEAAKIAGFLHAMGEEYELAEELRSAPTRAGTRRTWSKKPPQQCDECDFVGVNIGAHKARTHRLVAS